MGQVSVPCAVYRGGTSRGLFFNEKDLPEDDGLREEIFKEGIDAYNPSQIDGLGSGTSHSSKVCVISKSDVESVDVDYTFHQIGIGTETVDSKGTCGNLMAAVGAYAVDEGLVHFDPSEPYVPVTVYNTNINKLLQLKVPLDNGQAAATGDYVMPGLVRPGAKYEVQILDPGGGKTGQTLPLGSRTTIETSRKTYTISFVDVINPFVFISAEELEIHVTDSNQELSQDKALLEEIEEIRVRSAVVVGMSETVEEARKVQSIPKIAIVGSPVEYRTSDGVMIREDEVDLVSRMLSMGRFHRTFAGSGLYCLAAAARLPGTVPNEFTHDLRNKDFVRIGHPEGVVDVMAALSKDAKDVASVGLYRTARRIMKGELFVSS